MMPMPPQGHPPAPQMPSRPPVTIDDVMELLRDGAMRRFRVEIEADSTIVGDESQERKDRSEFIATLTQFMTAWGPMVMQMPELTKMAGDVLLFGVRGFRVGRELEETIEDTVERLEDKSGQPPPPNPEMIKMQMQAQGEQAKLEATKIKAQAEVMKAQGQAAQAQQESDAKLAQIQAQSVAEERKHQLETERMHMQLQHEREKHQMEVERAMHGHQLETEKFEMSRQQDEANAMRDAEKQEKDRQASHEHSAKLSEAVAANTQAIPLLAKAIVEHGKHIGAGIGKPKKVIRDKDGKVSGVE